MLTTASIAVIGASSSPHKVGHLIYRNLRTQGFQGKVYAVNPKGGEILGEPVYATLAEIPGPVDMAVIVTPAPTVPGVIRECIEKSINTVIVISAGFSETHTEEGKRLEQEMVNIIQSTSNQRINASTNQRINVIGPNCLGILIPSIGMNASFAKDLPKPGSIALISQSGAMAVALIDQSIGMGIGYSQILSIGNKVLLDECDFLEECESDPETKVIGLYLENISRGQHFLEVASRLTVKKPIVLLKSGVSEAGRKAAASHTGALAGSSAAISAVCAQAGIHRAATAEEFLTLLQTLSSQPMLRTNQIAVITNAGGPGILASDAAEAAGLVLPPLSASVGEKLQSKLPASASTGNPIDVIGDALTDRYVAALDAVGDDPGMDGVVVLLTPQVMTPVGEIALAISDFHARFPLMPVTACFMGGPGVTDGTNILTENGIPHFPTPEAAIRAMATLLPSPSPLPPAGAKARGGMRSARGAKLLVGRSGLLPEDITEKLFALYGLPQPLQKLATSAEEAARIADEIGFPVIAKISSPQILHKTDVGGIMGNLRSADEVREAFDQIVLRVANRPSERLSREGKSPIEQSSATINGILIQRHLPAGNEFIIGGLRDPSFGPMVMVGLGGIYTELFRDAVFRIAPVGAEEAYRMLTELRSFQILLGLRGKPRSDIDALAQTIVNVSMLLKECPEISELDCNPVLVSASGINIADAKVVVGLA
jgi:acetate---CoA ligase (ADP-forming)